MKVIYKQPIIFYEKKISNEDVLWSLLKKMHKKDTNWVKHVNFDLVSRVVYH